jgi:ribosomal protein S18 acetylase RimI-like enzyme
MILRPATPNDVPALVALARRSFTDAFGHLYAPENLATFLDTSRSPANVAASIADADTGVMLAEDAEGLIGYCTVYFNRGFAERPAPRPERPCLLSQLYCDSRATGQGVGAALIEWAIGEARARACDAMQLSVFSENFGAQRFYARYGFEKVADIDFWVGDHRDDEFLYELPLT